MEKLKKETAITFNQPLKTNFGECRDCRNLYSRAYKKQKYLMDDGYRVSSSVAARIRMVLRGKSKSARTLELLGCDTDFLKNHLEAQFQEGMTWENYGNPNGDHSDCWHIDHIKPCASFDLTDPEQQKQCFHYTNLQPLWGKDNMSKGSKYND